MVNSFPNVENGVEDNSNTGIFVVKEDNDNVTLTAEQDLEECAEDEWSCHQKGFCVPLSWVCDSHPDCEDGSDEKVCSHTCLPQEFTCGTGLCIHAGWVCDGEDDCSDGSDERSCDVIHCDVGQLLCSGGAQCVATSHVCDGDRDCLDGGDEINCGDRLVLDSHNITCRHGEFMCKEKPFCVERTWVCDGDKDCPDGSDESIDICKSVPKKIDTEKVVSDDMEIKNDVNENQNKDEFELKLNPCSVWPPVCGQVCVSVPHQSPGYKCECIQGYVQDPHDSSQCKAREGHPSLLFAHKSDVRKLSLDRPSMTAIVNNTRSSCAVDFHFKTGMVFWSDVREEKIYKAPIDSGYPDLTVVAETGVVTADGLAVDWVYNHVYWTDTGTDTISVSDFTGLAPAVLISGGLEEPRAIALHPGAGLMFWTDWGVEGKIERAGMDGSQRKVIIPPGVVRWPNGLSLDLVMEKLYWVDAKLHVIGCSNLDGSNIRTILSSLDYLRHPFSISVFGGLMYWSEWDTHAIYMADKWTGANITMVTSTDSVHLPMVLQVYHPFRQPDYPNLCLPFNGHCSHLCLPSPGPKSVSCKCPAALTLDSDNKTCIDQDSTRQVGEGENLVKSEKFGGTNWSTENILVTVTTLMMMTLILTLFIYYSYKQKLEVPLISLDNTECQPGVGPHDHKQGVHDKYQNLPNVVKRTFQSINIMRPTDQENQLLLHHSESVSS